MSSKIDKIKWELYNYKNKKLMEYGLKHGSVRLYDEELISKLRNIHYGGLPASVILLSDFMSNGRCYDRSLLLARAFLDEDVEVTLVYADVDSLRLNPKYISSSTRYAEHCFLEVVKDEKKYIYDTSKGLIYDKKMYWKLENPKVRKVRDKKNIRKFWEFDGADYNDDDKYMAPVLIPFVESHYNDSNEVYAYEGLELLQREVELYKELIDYNNLNKELNEKVLVK